MDENQLHNLYSQLLLNNNISNNFLLLQSCSFRGENKDFKGLVGVCR